VPSIITALAIISQTQAADAGNGLWTLLTILGTAIGAGGAGAGGLSIWQRRKQPQPQPMGAENSSPGAVPGCANTEAIKANADAIGVTAHSMERVASIVEGMDSRQREDRAELRDAQKENRETLHRIELALSKLEK
jgi:hypothetical protein